MSSCVKCEHYPWDRTIDPSQLCVFKKCHDELGPRKWTATSRDCENKCQYFTAVKDEPAEQIEQKQSAKRGGGRRTATAGNTEQAEPPATEPEQAEPPVDEPAETAEAES